MCNRYLQVLIPHSYASAAMDRAVERAGCFIAVEMAQILDRSTAIPDRDHGDVRCLGDRGLDLLQEAWLLANE